MNKNKNNFWRGLNELNKTGEFEKAKNLEFTDEIYEEKEKGFSRRKFLALLPASAAVAISGCANYRDKGEVVPYNKKPDYTVAGNPDFYASTCSGCSESCGILIKTREGRPVKIDGNPDHPVNKGKICSIGQAGIFNLYSPERIKEPQISDKNGNYNVSSWSTITEKIISSLKNAVSQKKGIALISNSVTSPSFNKLISDFKIKYPTSRHYVYETAGDENFINGYRKSFEINTEGQEFSIPSVNLDNAKVILCLEADILGTESNRLEYVRMFSENREVILDKKVNKLYAAESSVSITGLNADERFRIPANLLEEFVLCLINEILKRNVSSYTANSDVKRKTDQYLLETFTSKHNLKKDNVTKLIDDLIANQRAGYVFAGSILPESTHIAVNLINEILGNNALLNYESAHYYFNEITPPEEFEIFKQNIQSGNIEVILHIDVNPAYDFDRDMEYPELMKKVATVITLSEFLNETTSLSNYVLPLNHYLESWGDYRKRANLYSLQQPAIAPLYKTRQREEILLSFLNENTSEQIPADFYLKYLKENWEKNIYIESGFKSSFRDFWFNSLHDGIIKVKTNTDSKPSFRINAFSETTGKIKVANDLILILKRNHFLGNGRYANNGWLQEIPHPVSKIVWDNYAAISPATARNLGIKSNDLVEIKSGTRTMKIAAFVQPGAADNTISVELGYGRKDAGKIGTNIGFNGNSIINKTGLTKYLYIDAKISKTGDTYELVSTQEHYPIDQEKYKDIQFKRGIIREATFNEYLNNPDELKKEKKIDGINLTEFPSVNQDHEYTGVKWAMTIDLNKCIGCADCISACNVENNIPVVGKDQVKANREMHWIRIDRYYSGTPDEPKANFMPMLCQHCDLAPCENVCPVAATTHSEDGINGMAYNRCVGTRYCTNNCPYKVRRFNYFDFRDRFADGILYEEPVNQLSNPEVTVRSRGVMEKCTFCLQRIMSARQKATEEKRELKGSDVTTACQDACPSNAITFGDMNNKEDVVQKYREHKLSYTVLEDIKVKPNVTYTVKIRNT
ncbi:MAG: TAT-variant-translocated molybdopterin oxidoreductase [Ignavibacteria bacterium]|nr:TAT-variant-translocated molybdopterin oxidoreductase [Ignavibacteria bacterium]